MHVLSEKQYGKWMLTFHEAATSLRIEKVSQSINLGKKITGAPFMWNTALHIQKEVW